MMSVRCQGHPSASRGRQLDYSLPRKFDRQIRSARCATLALTIAVGMVGIFQAAALRVVFETIDQIPCHVRTALCPTGARGPDSLGPLAEREWRLGAMPVVMPDRGVASSRR